MKKIFSAVIAILCFITVHAQGYTITVHTHDYKSGLVYLAYHYGKSLDAQDSGTFDKNGTIVFSDNKNLPGGIYCIIFPGKTRTLDFFIDKSQVFTIKTDTADFFKKTTITGAPENDLFFKYQKIITPIGKVLMQEKNAYNRSATKADSSLHEANYVRYNKQLEIARDSIIKANPTSMLTALLLAMKDPQVLMQKPLTRQDSTDNYNYYKAHYWDGITFMDERIIRTPFFIPKVERYYRQVISQNPDSIIAESDYQLLLARTCPEMYKFLLNWLTDEYFTPRYMGQDAILVHLFEKYHSQGLSPWLTKKQEDLISNRAYMEMSNLVGEPAADLNLIDSSGKVTSLYALSADYTVVCFWDPTCGHCKIEIPRIDSIYQASWKKHNVKIYAVLTENVKTEWTKYIRENNIGDWTNVYQTAEMAKADDDANRPSFRQLYDVTATPTLYLLDKDKRIVMKHLDWEQINDFLTLKWANEAAANKPKK
ncbi:MAG TPA: thioredoxin-like domain-containing protein [Ferruginibacter sp.]|nr:thioredoxin-like domain-containing protein [Ferruginibacter sp.]